MPSSRHVGHRVGVRVCVSIRGGVSCRARFILPPGSRRSRWRDLSARFRALVREGTCLSQGARDTRDGGRGDTRDDREERRDSEGTGYTYISAGTFAALKQTLISGANPNPAPANVSARAERERGGDGWVRGGKGMAGWSQCAVCIPLGRKDSFVTPYSSTHSPKLVLVADVRVVVGFLLLALYS